MTDQERVIKDAIAFTERKEEERVFDNVKAYLNRIKRQRDNLKVELKKYKSDEKIVELKNEIEDLKANSLFIFNEDEKKEEIKLKKEHRDCNSSIYYFFKGTEVGVAAGLKCSKCGLIKDITDYSRW